MDQVVSFDESPDVNVKVGSEVFPCHRRVLILHSKYFENLFDGCFREANDNTITLPAEYVDEESFLKLLNAMYGQPLTIADDLPSLFIACSYLHLTTLTDNCNNHIMENLETIDLPRLIVLPQLEEYSSLYATVMRYICRHFSTFYPKMIRIPFDLVEELFKHEELLLFSREHALKFSKLWLGHYRRDRKNYRKKIAHLSLPFRDYRKAGIVNQCKRYIEDNFDADDMTELFLTFKPKENHPLYDVVKTYICENFYDVPQNELLKISFPVFKDLFSDSECFDMHDSAESVYTFSTRWVQHEESRKAFKEKVDKLMQPFDWYCESDYNYDYDYDFDHSDVDDYYLYGVDFSPYDPFEDDDLYSYETDEDCRWGDRFEFLL